jgi:alkylhydroperoxidase family enzyme
MRLPYAPLEPPASDPDATRVYAATHARRTPRPLQPLDLALLHAPLLAEGYGAFLQAVRTKSSLDPALRELAISRVAVLNKAPYEWGHHAPLAFAAGVSAQALTAISKKEVRWEFLSRPLDEGGCGLDAKAIAVLKYTDAMTVGVVVPDGVFGEVRGLFSEKEVVELTVTVAAYNAVSRVLVSLDGESSCL